MVVSSVAGLYHINGLNPGGGRIPDTHFKKVDYYRKNLVKSTFLISSIIFRFRDKRS